MSTANGISKALNAAFETPRTDLFDDLVAKLDRTTASLSDKLRENNTAATQVIAKAAKLDSELSPHKVKLRQRFRLPGARANHELASAVH